MAGTVRCVVAGGGMAGLGAALALSRADPALELVLLEQAGAFSEVGAGIQLGPNAMRVLHSWGLGMAVASCAAFPERLLVRDAHAGTELGQLRLGARARQRYGLPYATIHRADLHQLLLQAVRQSGRVDLQLNQRLQHCQPGADTAPLQLATEAGENLHADLLLGCDGLWSQVRPCVCGPSAPVFSGHLAYRGLLPMHSLPPLLRAHAEHSVNVWLGPRLHAVHYPVRSGEYLNVVVIVHGAWHAEAAHWDHAAHAADLQRALGRVAPDLNAVLHAVPQWRLWPLYVRPPMRSAAEHAQGRIGLLGDAAHPMPPYLAQGAAMALEDAWALGQCAAQPGALQDVPALLQRWAASRWQRNAWVQARARRNGTIFHARGPLRWGRNWAMAALGESLLDVPALYAGPTLPF